jgi:hypothetical protein
MVEEVSIKIILCVSAASPEELMRTVAKQNKLQRRILKVELGRRYRFMAYLLQRNARTVYSQEPAWVGTTVAELQNLYVVYFAIN